MHGAADAEERAERAQRQVERLSYLHTPASAARTWPEVISALRRAVGFDRWCVVINDPHSATFTAAAVTGTPVTAEEQRRFWTLETAVPDLNKPTDVALMRNRVRLLSAATGGELARSPRWEELLGPQGIGDELRVALVAHGCWWGSLALYRDSSDPPFRAADADVVERLIPPLARMTRSAWAAPAQCRPVSEPLGTFVLDAEGKTISATEAAAGWLGRLDPDTQQHGRVTDCLLARLQSEENEQSAVNTVLRDVHGEWVELTVARLQGPHGPGSFAVTVQPAPSGTVRDVLMHVFALTPRERQIASLALTGATSGDIAKKLSLSRYTVADHLSAICTKTGAPTRYDLARQFTADRAPA
jgi:DNA-binding CsgD family transcriptional regulator